MVDIPPAYRRLSTWVIVTAALLTCAGLVIGTGAARADWLAGPTQPGISGFLLACAAAGLAQVPRLRLGAGRVNLAWGEAAIIVLCYLLPVAWVPAALVVGVGGAHILLSAFERRTARQLMTAVGSLTIAGTLAALVARGIAPTVGAQVRSGPAIALCAAALVYFAATSALAAASLASRGGGAFLIVWRDTARSKYLMVIGNVVIGLLIVALRRTDNGVWLVLIPPVVWLLHQAYAYRLRGDGDRHAWEAFSEAVRELNRLDERHAAEAGIAGAVRLFRALAVEVVVHDPHTADRIYTSDAAGSAPVGALTVHPLIVGETKVGELRMRTPGRGLVGGRDRYMFAAYGDALAAVLHDAVTHSALRVISERSRHDAVHDPLTGAVNRAALLTRGNAALAGLDARTPVAMLLLDINRFKEVNNALGHAAGDDLLRVIAVRLASGVRAGEQVARLGGDEFAVLLNPDGADDAEPLAYAVDRARRLIAALAEPVEVAGVQLSVEASVGVVAANAGAVDMTELLRRADIAMYQAKRSGQGVAWYDPTRDEASTDRLALLAEMREAVAGSDQLHLLLQPTVRLADGVVTGVEALARWEHPRRGPLMPADFLAPVEHSELIGQFTRYVLADALRIMAGWRAHGVDLPISVNLSPRGLLDPRLPGDVAELLYEYRVPADRLVLEITEGVVIADLPVIDEVLGGLRALGVRLAVDDFGTGFSSLTFLTRVQVDEVKIDRAFVARMVDSPEAAAIVRTTVDLGRELNLRVVAEGVETAEQRTALLSLGCVAAQGYLFYPPMPAAKVLAAIQAQRPANVRQLRRGEAG